MVGVTWNNDSMISAFQDYSLKSRRISVLKGFREEFQVTNL